VIRIGKEIDDIILTSSVADTLLIRTTSVAVAFFTGSKNVVLGRARFMR
jgi:hypothetical protein